MSADPTSLTIVLHPEGVLRRIANPVDPSSDEVRAVAERMLVLMHEAEGIGLAAPQVGLSWRLFVTRDPDDRDGPGGLVFMNPVVTVTDQVVEESIEGCLSLPGIEVTVRRPRGVRIEAIDLAGQAVVQDRDDHFARVYQHETDHLNGVLIIDRMTTMDRMRNRRALRDLERA